MNAIPESLTSSPTDNPWSVCVVMVEIPVTELYPTFATFLGEEKMWSA